MNKERYNKLEEVMNAIKDIDFFENVDVSDYDDFEIKLKFNIEK